MQNNLNSLKVKILFVTREYLRFEVTISLSDTPFPKLVADFPKVFCNFAFLIHSMKFNTPFRLSILLTLLMAAQGMLAQSIDINNIKKHIQYLASDKLQGRSPGEKGEKLAAAYISKYYRSLHVANLSTAVMQPFEFKESANPHDTANGKIQRNGKNVYTFLDNGAPYTIVIGAHYDHLGKGNHGNSLDPNPVGKIHNGADDNASGTAGVMELARYYATNGIKENCNFLFIHFSAEESGLIGSKYFSNHPSIDLNTVQCMINMDMIGRLNDSTHSLMVHGVGTSPAFVNLVQAVPHNGMKLTLDSSGIGPSDFTSFYLKNVPVLAVFTGSHNDYHKPSDDADKINYPGEVTVLQYVTKLVDTLCIMHKLPFTQTRNQSNDRVSFKVTLGIMPDYSYSDEGVKADGVTDGRPAAKAGIKAGDIIIKMGTHDIHTIQDYMKALASFKKGESTEVTVKRGAEIKVFTVTF